MLLFPALTYFLLIFPTPGNLLEAGINGPMSLSRESDCPWRETSEAKSIRLLGTETAKTLKEERTLGIALVEQQLQTSLGVLAKEDIQDYRNLKYPTRLEFYQGVKDLDSYLRSHWEDLRKAREIGGDQESPPPQLSDVLERKKLEVEKTFYTGLRLLNEFGLDFHERILILGTLTALREALPKSNLGELNLDVRQGPVSRGGLEISLLQGVDMVPTLISMRDNPTNWLESDWRGRDGPKFAALWTVVTIVEVQKKFRGKEVSDLNGEFTQLHDQLLLLGVECDQKSIESLISQFLRLKTYEYEKKGNRLSKEESQSVEQIASYFAKLLDELQGRERPILTAVRRIGTIFRIQRQLQGIEVSRLNGEFIQLHDRLLLLGVECDQKTIESLISQCFRLKTYEFGTEGKPLTEKESLSVWRIASHLGKIDKPYETYLALQLSKNEKILLDYKRFQFEDTFVSDLEKVNLEHEVRILMLPLKNLRSATLKHFEDLLDRFRWGHDLHNFQFVASKLDEAAKHVDRASLYLESQIEYDEKSNKFKLKLKPRVKEEDMSVCSICLEGFSVGEVCFQVHRDHEHLFHQGCLERWINTCEEQGSVPTCPYCKGKEPEQCLFILVERPPSPPNPPSSLSPPPSAPLPHPVSLALNPPPFPNILRNT